MIKGNGIWALGLLLVLGACATESKPSATTNSAPTETPSLITRMRDLEAEVATIATTKSWSAQLTGDSQVERAWLDGANLLLEAYNPATRNHEIYCIDVNGGRGRWMIVLGKNRLARAPHIGGGSIALVTELDGALALIDARTGSRMYTYEVKLGVVPSTDATSKDATVYVGNYLTERLVAVSGLDGGRSWDVALNGLCTTTPILTPRLASPLVVVCTDRGTVAAVAAKQFNEVAPTGPEWTRQLAAPVSADPTLVELAGDERVPAVSLLAVPCEDMNVYGLDAATGRSRWVLRSNAPFTASPVATGGILFARNGERMFAVDPKTGQRVWMPAAPEGASDYEKAQLFGSVQGYEEAERALGANNDRAYLLRGRDTVFRCDLKTGAVQKVGSLGSFDFLLSNQATGTLIAGTKDGIFVAYE
jgi:outer membrane protein assembly factor BamB